MSCLALGWRRTTIDSVDEYGPVIAIIEVKDSQRQSLSKRQWGRTTLAVSCTVARSRRVHATEVCASRLNQPVGPQVLRRNATALLMAG